MTTKLLLGFIALVMASSMHNCTDRRSEVLEGNGEVVTGQQRVSRSFNVILDHHYLKQSWDTQGSFIDQENRFFWFRAFEIPYSFNYTKSTAIREFLAEIPAGNDLLKYRSNDLEFYGYYEYVIEREGEVHGFNGFAFGKRSMIGIIFAFEDIHDLQRAKAIWLSTRRR